MFFLCHWTQRTCLSTSCTTMLMLSHVADWLIPDGCMSQGRRGGEKETKWRGELGIEPEAVWTTAACTVLTSTANFQWRFSNNESRFMTSPVWLNLWVVTLGILPGFCLAKRIKLFALKDQTEVSHMQWYGLKICSFSILSKINMVEGNGNV